MTNPSYLIFSRVNGYFEEINGNKYLTLVPNNGSKEIINKYEELWSKIRDLIRSIIKKSDDYNEKHKEIKFDSDDDLPLNKTIEIHIVAIVVRAIFLENNKYYAQFFLHECLHKSKTISVYCYLIKYKAKQKQLLPFYVTNNKLKSFVLVIYYKNEK